MSREIYVEHDFGAVVPHPGIDAPTPAHGGGVWGGHKWRNWGGRRGHVLKLMKEAIDDAKND